METFLALLRFRSRPVRAGTTLGIRIERLASTPTSNGKVVHDLR